MSKKELLKILEELMNLPNETEYIEFKEAKNEFSFEKLGEYFSALSNEANLKKQKYAWLIFGITDKVPRKVSGTNYREGIKLQKLKEEIAQHTTNKITFDEIFEVEKDDKRVLMFRILPSPKNLPIAFKGHYYGRDNEALGALNISEIEQIRKEGIETDWSKQICIGATIADLEPEAIKKARENYIVKNPRQIREIETWDDITFLNKAKITINGEITKTAILLLGKNESDHYLSPAVAKVSWILQDDESIPLDYEHFGPPFLLNIEEIFKKIRNLKYRYIPNETLFPVEIYKYEPYVIREALNNSIAHQDYNMFGKINLIEKKDEIIISNLGNFIPGSIENVLDNDSPSEYYRNPFLAGAMVNLNMIDTIGSGIKKMMVEQRNRYFPLPDFKISDDKKVEVKIIGKILDENYTNLLKENNKLTIKEVYLLDKVQKKENISKEELKILKDLKLVEGRYPNVFISSKLSKTTEDKTKHIKNRAFDNDYYKNLLLSYLKEYGSATRKEINELLEDKLSDVLSEEQKDTRIKNILYDMSKKDNLIVNSGSNRYPRWELIKKK